MPDPNAEWLAEVQRAVETIKACDVFGPDICSQEPPPLTGDPETTLLGFHAPYTEAVARAVDDFCKLATSRDAQEGLRAFLEKRKPDWSDT